MACGLRLEDEAVHTAVAPRLGIFASLHMLATVSLWRSGRRVWSSESGLQHAELSGWLQAINYIMYISLPDHLYQQIFQLRKKSTDCPLLIMRDQMASTFWHGRKENRWYGMWLWSARWRSRIIRIMQDTPTPGSAAELAASRKSNKYADLPSSNLFQLIAFKNWGAINESAI